MRGAVATAMSAAPGDVRGGAARAGWSPPRAAANDYQASYDLVATRGLRGAADPPAAARRPTSTAGWPAASCSSRGRRSSAARAPPRGVALCTSAFLVRLGAAPRRPERGALRRPATQPHDAAPQRRAAPAAAARVRARQRATQPRPRREALDALVLPVPSGAGRPAARRDRSLHPRPPWFVVRHGPAAPRPRRVCFSGIRAGPTTAATIVRTLPAAPAACPCTPIIARPGDSGSPVYTEPGADGTVRAVGIAYIVFGLLQSMRFVPIAPVLDALDATIVTRSPACRRPPRPPAHARCQPGSGAPCSVNGGGE